MKRYEVVFSKRAEKDVEKLPAKTVERIIPVIISLEDIQDLPAAKN